MRHILIVFVLIFALTSCGQEAQTFTDGSGNIVQESTEDSGGGWMQSIGGAAIGSYLGTKMAQPTQSFGGTAPSHTSINRTTIIKQTVKPTTKSVTKPAVKQTTVKKYTAPSRSTKSSSRRK